MSKILTFIILLLGLNAYANAWVYKYLIGFFCIFKTGKKTDKYFLQKNTSY